MEQSERIDVAGFNRAFAAQKAHSWDLRKSSAAERIVRLQRLRASLVAHREDLAQALNQDLGRPVATGGYVETEGVLLYIDHTIANLEAWMAPTTVEDLSVAGSAYIRYESRGVVLLFGAWNFPVTLLFEPLVAIISAGNTAIVKPNEVTPAVSALTAKILRETFEEREVAVFEGDPTVSNALLELPVDHIFFTGSPAVGRTVMTAVAKHLASVTLELGGKSPLIIDDAYDLDAAMPSLLYGKYFNDGQVCISPDYLLVPNDRIDAFVEKFKAAIQGMFYPDGKYLPERNTHIVNARGFDRIEGYIKDAVERGARIAFGGGTDREKLLIEPTVLVNVPAGSAVLENEIFGPVLPVVGYDDPDEAIAFIRARTKPLSLYIYSDDDAFVTRIVENTTAGGTTVNGWADHFLEQSLPFGGVGDSGMGAYHGIFGFRELSHARAVAFAKKAAS
ncbi:aldehyde dehydrogenase family protein [Sphingomonas sp. MG17]|uniref:Aldehyde dehydrogenase n=1 Tax=Sphingomonas tagetis TaxID=2949092 RepID=A0A9X2KLE3_9SPHN|nr:aldehyde dehydrogenase family protein [Sphingomonas tagetis]MCP3730316.1 aldehyde dehydrogenase family protein [Sphingomonas tagetis]